MKNILTFSFLFAGILLNAQMGGSEFDVLDLQNMNSNLLDTDSGVINVNDIEGSPYLNIEFRKGRITEKENGQVIEAYLRYNIFEDKFEIKPSLNDDKVFALKRSSNYEYIYDNSEVQLIANNKLFNKSGNGFVFVLLRHENNLYNLYKKYDQKFTAAEKGKTPYDADKPASLKTNLSYYISKDISKGFIELEVNRRKILDAFEPNLKSEMKDYMKSNKYKLRGNDTEVENELINIISHYNTLLNN